MIYVATSLALPHTDRIADRFYIVKCRIPKFIEVMRDLKPQWEKLRQILDELPPKEKSLMNSLCEKDLESN